MHSRSGGMCRSTITASPLLSTGYRMPGVFCCLGYGVEGYLSISSAKTLSRDWCWDVQPECQHFKSLMWAVIAPEPLIYCLGPNQPCSRGSKAAYPVTRAWFLFPTLPLAYSMASVKFLHLSVPQFPRIWDNHLTLLCKAPGDL